MNDKTNYAQSLMHMIKGNLGTGILAMPASFAHTGLINAVIGLPILCLVSTYCVHLLVRSSQRLENKSKGYNLKYASLAEHSFKSGPKWLSKFSGSMCRFVDLILLIAQLGVCCVYLVFVVENITSILASYSLLVSKTTVFIAIFPIALLLSYIRTLKRLAIASAGANLLQAVGISLILEYLVRDIDQVNLSERDNFRPLNEVALGFGSAMFAFEGISVVLPVYTRMKHSHQMSECFGVINFSYIILLILYFVMGLFGFLKFGHHAGDSITLNLPPEPIYDAVRAIFAISVILTYPLQFYVPNEIIWHWAREKLFKDTVQDVTVARAIEVVIPPLKGSGLEKQSKDKQQQENENNNKQVDANQMTFSEKRQDQKPPKVVEDTNAIHYNSIQQARLSRYEYLCRTILVTLTFVLAISVPKLNLLMDLIGSITGTTLSLILPAIIHLATFWNELKGFQKVIITLVDFVIIFFGFVAGASGSVFSLRSIVESFSTVY